MTEQNTTQPLSVEEAKEAVKKAMSALAEPENQKRLRDILDECASIEDPMMQIQVKFARLLPAVTEVLGTAFHGRDVMGTVMQVQSRASQEPELAVNVGKIMRALAGDLTAVEEEEEFEDVE